jgi:ankyrin repeat protein
MKLLFEHMTTDHSGKYEQTPLAEVTRQGQTNALNYLLNLNQYGTLFGEPLLIRVDPESRDNGRKLALVHAAENGHTRCVRSLLDQERDAFCSEPTKSRAEDILIAFRIAREHQDWPTLQALSSRIHVF